MGKGQTRLNFGMKKEEPVWFLSSVVRRRGLEPLRLTALDPKSNAATNYATSANGLQKYIFFQDRRLCQRKKVYLCRGKLPEWSIGADSKSVDLFGGPGVRIPHFPPSPSIKGVKRTSLLFDYQEIRQRLAVVRNQY